MPYNTLVQRADVDALIPQNVSNLMLTSLEDTSAALALGQRIPMPAGATRFPVLSALPQAYWVTGDTGLKQTSTAAWDDKWITVEELAVIIPVPEAVLEDSGFDLWGAVRPLMEAAIARKFDAAVFLGVEKPASFPAALDAHARAAGNEVVRGSAAADEGGFAADVSDLLGLVEDDGYDPTGGIARTGLRGMIRRLGLVPAQLRGGGDLTADDWFGISMRYPMRGLWPTAVSTTEAVIGDFSNLVVGVRRDFSYKLLDQGVITDNASPPAIVFNLPQQDMIALRLTFRAGYQIANAINWDQPTEAARSPFGVMTRPAT
jgi:hypothetical protein